MMTKYRRTLATKCRMFERDCWFWWDRNREGVYAGAMVGSFSVLIAFYLVWGV